MQGNFAQGAAVGLGEIGPLKVAFKNLGLAQEARFDDLVGLEFLLGTDHIVAGVQVVHLASELLGLLFGSFLLAGDVLGDGVERVHALVQVLDLDVCCRELLGQAVDGLLLVLELSLQVVDGLLHRGVIVGGLLQAALQLGQTLFVLVDGLLDQYDVVTQLFLAVGSLAVQVVYRHDVLQFLDLLHAVGNVAHELHQAVLLGIGSVDRILQRSIDGILAHGLLFQLVGALAGGHDCQAHHEPYEYRNTFHIYQNLRLLYTSV